MKKIAVIGLKGLPAFGGAASVGENIIEQLKDQYDFTVYATSSHTSRNTGSLNGYHQIVLKKLPFKKINTLFYYVTSAIHCVFFSHYDLIHLHHNDAAFIIPLLKLRYKVLLTTHGAFDVVEKWQKYRHYFNLQTSFFTRFANLITCVSKNDQRNFKSKLNLDVIYIPNGITIIDENKLIEPKYRDYIYFSAGRILRSKGCEIFLKALKQIDFKGKIIISGDLEQSINLKEEILRLKEGLDVILTGLIKDKKELFGYLANAKLFVFPSNREAMSMMLLEAISAKVPTICSDIIENKDVLFDDEVLFFETDDTTDLSQKILYALNNYEEMKDISLKAFNRMSREYSWSKIAEKYKNAFDSLLN